LPVLFINNINKIKCFKESAMEKKKNIYFAIIVKEKIIEGVQHDIFVD